MSIGLVQVQLQHQEVCQIVKIYRMLLLIFCIAERCYTSAESLKRILFEDSSDEWNVEED